MMSTTQKSDIFLNVPFKEKDHAKSLGARWNPERKQWYIPSGMDPIAFAIWMNPDEAQAILDAAKTTTSVTSTPPDEQSAANSGLSLSQYLFRITEAVNSVGQTPVWLRAEISSLSAAKRGHYYFDLVEHNAQGTVQAKAKAILWSSQAKKVLAKFKKATDAELQANIKILIEITTRFDPLYGLSLNISDIDPSYTLGDMAAKLAEIRKQLQNEQIYHLNKEYSSPTDFTRVAVISPDKAAGLGDFQAEANILQDNSLCLFEYYPAQFQGPEAPKLIRAAIEKMRNDHNKNPFDVVVIIRGGGAVTDLAWLNDYELAKDVCKIPIPVFTGIGHQRDDTILDEISCQRFDTPSKVSNYIISAIAENALQANNDFKNIQTAVKHTLSLAVKKIEQGYRYIGQHAEHQCLYANQCLDENYRTLQQGIIRNYQQAELQCQTQKQHIFERSQNFLNQVERSLEQRFDNIIESISHKTELADGLCQQMFKQIMGLSPEHTLKRGYVVAQDYNGQTITSRETALSLESFFIRFQDGQLNVCPKPDTNDT